MSSYTDFMEDGELPFDTNDPSLVAPSESFNVDSEFEHMISGMGIQSDDNGENQTENSRIIDELNAHNAASAEEEIERQEAERREKEAADQAILKERQKELYRLQYEREQEEKKRREEEEAIEEENRLRMEEEKRMSSPVYKIKAKVSGWKEQVRQKKEQEMEEKKQRQEKKAAAEAAAEVEALASKTPASKMPAAEVTPEVNMPAANIVKDNKVQSIEDTAKKPAASSKKEKKASKKEAKVLKNETKSPPVPEEKDWKYLATHDEMTGLYNERSFKEAFDKSEEGKVHLVLFDVNDLRDINQILGEAVGDRVILATAAAILENFQSEGFRLEGDNFAVLLHMGRREALDKIPMMINRFQSSLKEASKKDPDKAPYAVSCGYAVWEKDVDRETVLSNAKAALSEAKKAYRNAHPAPPILPKKTAADEKAEKGYDDLLSKDQKELKGTVQANHSSADRDQTERIIAEIQRRQSEVRCILIASPTFDHLFIITNVNTFTNMILEMDALIDYSYLYVVYDGGPQYYGSDEYYSEVTHLFEDISEALRSPRGLTQKDILRIKGINIFKNIYIE